MIGGPDPVKIAYYEAGRIPLDNDMMPPHDSDEEEAALRQSVMLGLVSLFIPLTAHDVAIETATLEFGRVARLFDGAVDYFRSIRNGIRAGIDNYVAAVPRPECIISMMIRDDY